MTRLIGARLLQLVPLLFGITFATYAIVNLVPGSPLNSLEMNPRVKPADIARARSNLGLDQPWPVRYFVWLRHAVRGDLGVSLADSTPVAGRIRAVLPNTLLLTGSSLVIALVLSVPLGVLSAVKHNSVIDHLITVGALAAYAIPSFWLAFLSIILFAVKFHEWGLPALPVSGSYDLRGGGDLADRLRHLILPAFTLGIVELAGWTRYIRSSMLEIVGLDFIRTARSKGLRERSVLYGHAFRNALLPLVTLVGLSLPGLFGGAFITESIFSWNGMGLLAVKAARANDYPMIMGAALIFAMLTVAGNLVADLLYVLLDPRVRYEQR